MALGWKGNSFSLAKGAPKMSQDKEERGQACPKIRGTWRMVIKTVWGVGQHKGITMEPSPEEATKGSGTEASGPSLATGAFPGRDAQ